MVTENNNIWKASWFRWLIAVGLLAAGFCLGAIYGDLQPFWDAFKAPLWVLCLIASAVVIGQLLFSMRLALSIEHCGGPRLSVANWFRLTSVGQFLNLLVPQSGNVYRASELKRLHGLSYRYYSSGLLGFVWLDLLCGVFLAGVVVALVNPYLTLGQIPAIPLLLAMACLIFSMPFLLHRLLARWVRDELRFAALLEKITAVLAMTTSMIHNGPLLLKVLLLNILMVFVYVSALWGAFIAVGADVDPGVLMILHVSIQLTNQIVITPGNLGLNELVYGAILALTTHGLAFGLAASLLIRTVGITVVVTLGVALGGRQWLRKKDRPVSASDPME